MAYTHTNSKGDTYTLHRTEAKLKSGQTRVLQFFSRDVRPTAIHAELERRLRHAESRALQAGAWGEPIDIHLGRRLYALARRVPVERLEPVSVVWERVAPLSDVESRFLHGTTAWLVDPASQRWLRRDRDECSRLSTPTATIACSTVRICTSCGPPPQSSSRV